MNVSLALAVRIMMCLTVFMAGGDGNDNATQLNRSQKLPFEDKENCFEGKYTGNPEGYQVQGKCLSKYCLDSSAYCWVSSRETNVDTGYICTCVSNVSTWGNDNNQNKAKEGCFRKDAVEKCGPDGIHKGKKNVFKRCDVGDGKKICYYFKE